MKNFTHTLPPGVRVSLVFALEALAFALTFLDPGFFQALAALLALVAAATTRISSGMRVFALGLLVFFTTVGLALKTGSDLLFIVLVGALIVLIRVRDVPLWFKISLSALILLVSVPVAGFANTFLLELSIQIGIYAAMALGLNVVVGMAGLLDLGYAAFFAIGAYTWAIFGSPQAAAFIQNYVPLGGTWFYPFMFVAIVTTAVTGILIGLPALRLRGDYLAIVTLGLGEVVRVLANNLDHPVNITNGPQGISPIARPPIGAFQGLLHAVGIPQGKSTDYQLFFYLLVLLVIGIVVLVNVNLSKSKFGRAWVALREDEVAAKAMGIPMVKTKLLAFSTGAAFSGAMGVIFAAQRGFVSPESFTLLASITILGMVVLGGMGSITGVILGTAALTILNLDVLKSFSEYLNTLRQSGASLLGFSFSSMPNQVDPAKFERLVFGIVLILMMIFRPEGLIPEARHKVEANAEKELT
jgi:branched-chain amino acid transport system permease protein